MFFLIRMVFWLAVVLAWLPSGGAKPGAAAPGVTAACGQAGARKVHDVSRPPPSQTRSMPTTAATRSPAANPSRGTLTAADVAPAWRGPRADLPKRDGA
jgi:hypothetical protein